MFAMINTQYIFKNYKESYRKIKSLETQQYKYNE